MPVPGGEITSTETWSEAPLEEAIKSADAEPAVEEFTLDEEVVEEWYAHIVLKPEKRTRLIISNVQRIGTTSARIRGVYASTRLEQGS